ncbi:hypothetical protein [Clostridium estertheticum]|uniref:Uncharacterized protein n=1 Tax=Clostridium estertheticum TaxID=238834 RepID=A0A7Y3SXX5_9CLOT|nr:hypothetical protein [Clostridium estertheticum]NNU77222.1 hypothetical protein [Clostridium estertheticum]
MNEKSKEPIGIGSSLRDWFFCYKTWDMLNKGELYEKFASFENGNR